MITFAAQKKSKMVENDSIIQGINNTIQDTTVIHHMAQDIKKLTTTSPSQWLPDFIHNYLIPLGIKIVAAIAVYLLGRWVIKIVKKMMLKSMERHHADPTLGSFLISLVSALLIFFLIISIVGILGINTSSLVALLASAGLAIGMALSGTLQNFAGGVMIMFFKPFRVGDYILAQGYEGTVKEIRIFNTYLKTRDNKIVILPNGPLSTGSITNYSTLSTRRVDWTFSIAYGDDYDKAKAVLTRLCNEDHRILKSPEPFIELGQLNNSSVDITVRVWTKSADYWDVFFAMNERVYKNFAKEGLNIPFPQMDVHMKA